MTDADDKLVLPDIYWPVFWDCVDKSPHPKGCWIWIGQTNSDGYGRFVVRKKSISAHRITCRMKHGPLGEGVCACHTCDNPSCVNPDHLFPGTKLDNARDRESKGRGNKPTGDKHWMKRSPEKIKRGEDHWAARMPERYRRGDNHPARLHPERMCRGDRHPKRLRPELNPRGEKHPLARLTETQVIEIRRIRDERVLTLQQIADKFGMTKSSIEKIVHRKQWTHI